MHESRWWAPLIILLSVLLAGTPLQIPGIATAVSDTVQAEDPIVNASVLRPFSIERPLTLARGDSCSGSGQVSDRANPVLPP